jgi:pyruvate,water dikinase
VAREFGVPTLVDSGSATKLLPQGAEVTVNANEGIVYEGRVQHLLEGQCAVRHLTAENPFMTRMRRVLDHISPLNLVDPRSENFAPEGCRTFHDILRFCHEKAVHAMFSLGARGNTRVKGAKKLVSDIPIVLHLLDLGHGLRREAGAKKEVEIDDILSHPLKAIWKGLSHPDIYWDPNIKHLDWKEFDRISAGIVNFDALGSYAVIAGDYLNMNIHFGYHFIVLDTLCGEQTENNYIMLRFAGGGADLHSRSLRVQFIAQVLSFLGFKTEMKGDLIDSEFARDDKLMVEEKLVIIGSLLGCTRLLDMALEEDWEVEAMVNKFLGGRYDLSPIRRR